MEEQKVYQDQIEARVNEFMENIVKKYQLLALAQGQIESIPRGVGLPYLLHCDKLTDNVICELIVKNHLVAMAYLRREDANYTEVNFVVFESVIKQLKEK